MIIAIRGIATDRGKSALAIANAAANYGAMQSGDTAIYEIRRIGLGASQVRTALSSSLLDMKIRPDTRPPKPRAGGRG